MPNSRSAKKALRQNETRRQRNRAQRSTLRTAVKRVRTAATGDDQAAKDTAFVTATKSLDQAASKNLIHKNKAARLKSRLAKALAAKEAS